MQKNSRQSFNKRN